jgi:hypothetical protein
MIHKYSKAPLTRIKKIRIRSSQRYRIRIYVRIIQGAS